MGWLSDNFIADFFKMALQFIYDLVGSYGWSIVILTVLFRLLILPLDIKSKKNTRKQQKLQPKLQVIQKKYANDKEMQQKKTMELYKEESFNPMAGCLPVLIQMPIFFAFYGSIIHIAGTQIIEMYKVAEAGGTLQLESWLWIKNLWQADTFWAEVFPAFDKLTRYSKVLEEYGISAEMYEAAFKPYVTMYGGQTNGLFILPLLAGAMSFFQSKLAMPATPQQDNKKNDQPANPMSGKTMQYMMPFISVFICISASAAFALYWSVSNLVSVMNYYVMNKIFAAQEEQQDTIIIEEKPSRKMERKLPKI